MDNYFRVLSFVFSIVALGLSIYAVSNEYYADIPTTVLSLVGICATLIVGVSVVDAISLRSTLKQMDEKMIELNKRIDDLSKVGKKVHKMRKQTNILFHHTWGLSFASHEPYAAFAEFWKAFELAAKEGDVKRAKSCLDNAELTVEDIISRNSNNEELDVPDMERIPDKTPENIKNTKIYYAFADKVDALIIRINQAIKK